MLKIRGIRGVGAEFLGKCSGGSLERKLSFPIQNLWDYFFEEPKNGVFLLSCNKSCGIWPISNQITIQRGKVTAYGDPLSLLLLLRFFALGLIRGFDFSQCLEIGAGSFYTGYLPFTPDCGKTPTIQAGGEMVE